MKKLKSKTIFMFLVKDVHALEHDPSIQYKFNRTWAFMWGICMIIVPTFPSLYGHNVSALIIQEISLWANFATHFAGMSAALAATDTANTVDDVQDRLEQVVDTLVEDDDQVTTGLPDQSLPASTSSGLPQDISI